MSTRPKRQVKIKEEAAEQRPRKWTEDEMSNLLQCIMEHGHKNFDKLQECLPGRSLENIKTFMRTVYDNGTKRAPKDSNLDDWIEFCLGSNVGESAWKDCIQVAQVLKYLSVDGLIENHPLPQHSENINFAEAYRFIYQAVMGYPLQPVSPETGKLIHETIAELNNEAKKETHVIEKLGEFLKRKLESQAPENKDNLSKIDLSALSATTNKPLKVYQRKKPRPQIKQEVVEPPSLKIFVEASTNDYSESEFTQNFFVTIQGKENDIQQQVVNVPVPVVVSHPKLFQTEEEKELFKSKSYNPFEIPEEWIYEPVYLNIMHKL